MGSVNLDNYIKIHDLKQIPLIDGDVFHGIKKTDDDFVNFGEAYFSFIKKNKIKAWKRHNIMYMNLIVPVGQVKFVFYLNDQFKEIIIGQNNYKRIFVPPKIWFGFQGLDEKNIILNISSIIHNPDEVNRLEKSKIKYKWQNQQK